MHTYARVVTGVVMEIVSPITDNEGNEVPITDRFTPEIVAEMVDVTTVTPLPQCWWTYNGASFTAASGPSA